MDKDSMIEAQLKAMMGRNPGYWLGPYMLG